jgi:hypothetical protein
VLLEDGHWLHTCDGLDLLQQVAAMIKNRQGGKGEAWQMYWRLAMEALCSDKRGSGGRDSF